MHLGVCNNTGLVYEEMGAADMQMNPTAKRTRSTSLLADAEWTMDCLSTAPVNTT